jgi:hypothetical protein
VRIHRLGVDRVSRSFPAVIHYLRVQKPDVLITRQMHANFVGFGGVMDGSHFSPLAGKDRSCSGRSYRILAREQLAR